MSFLINPYAFGDGIPTENLVLYTGLNSNVVDETGNFTITNSGVAYSSTSPPSGSAYGKWEQNGDHLVVPNSSLIDFGDGSTDSPFSISFWIYGTSWASNPRIIDKRSSSSTNLEIRGIILASDSLLRLVLYDDSTGGNINIRTSTALSTTTWYHYVFTYDGSGVNTGMTVYLDGADDLGGLFSSGSYTAMEALGEDIIIGKDAASTSNTLTGWMDSIAIWDKELTASEVSDIYDKQNAGNELL